MPIVVNGTTLTDIYVGNTKLTRVQVRENENSIFVVVFEQGGVVKVAYIYAGNWKMNKLKADIDSFFTDFNANLNQNSNKEVIIFPPACYLSYVKEKIDASPRSSMIKLGVQNICNADAAKGSYTGQISAQQAADCGCEYVLVGNSEVRSALGLTNEQCRFQIKQALAFGLKVIYCVGENITERDAGQTLSVLTTQLTEGLFGATGVSASTLPTNFAIVYEPVWAVGTGRTCSVDMANEACATIRNIIENTYDTQTANNTPILYGGTMNVRTAAEFLSQSNIEGGLFPAVSLQAANFASIINENT